MPMNVGITLVTAQCQEIHALCSHLLTDGFRDPIHDALLVQVFLNREVAGCKHSMIARSDEAISIAPGIGVEKDDRRIVLVDDLDWQLPSIPLSDDGADKALPTFRMPLGPCQRFRVRVISLEMIL